MQSNFVSRAAFAVTPFLVALFSINSFGNDVGSKAYINPPLSSDAGISTIHSPNGSSCSELVTLSVELKNYGSTDLTSVDIIWDIDLGGPLLSLGQEHLLLEAKRQ